jgi:hypothetical protein
MKGVLEGLRSLLYCDLRGTSRVSWGSVFPTAQWEEQSFTPREHSINFGDQGMERRERVIGEFKGRLH